jgi:hypothetical protein
MNPLQRKGLLTAIADRPAGDKVRVADLARSLAVTQAEAVVAIEHMVADGRLEAATLRPPSIPAPEATRVGERKVPIVCTGAQLFSLLKGEAERRDMPFTAVSAAALGSGSAVYALKHGIRQIRDRTRRRVEAWLNSTPAAPPPCAEPVRRTLTGKVSKRSAYCQQPGACTAPRFGPCRRCQAASCVSFTQARRKVRDVSSERRAAAGRRSQTAEAARILDANPDAISGRNASVTAAIGQVRRQRADEARAADPIEQAKLALRKRGRIVFDASVDGGRKGRFFVSGQNHPETGKRLQLTEAELIALAQRVNPLALRAAPATIQGRAEQ